MYSTTYHEEYNAEGECADEKETGDTHGFDCHRFENTARKGCNVKQIFLLNILYYLSPVQIPCEKVVDHDGPACEDSEDGQKETQNRLPNHPEGLS